MYYSQVLIERNWTGWSRTAVAFPPGLVAWHEWWAAAGDSERVANALLPFCYPTAPDHSVWTGTERRWDVLKTN